VSRPCYVTMTSGAPVDGWVAHDVQEATNPIDAVSGGGFGSGATPLTALSELNSMGRREMHDDDVAISDELARVLIDSQFPEYAGLALERLPRAGTVNVIFRIGDDLSARFPRRAGDTNATRAALERETDRAVEFANRSPVNAPRPVAIGGPAHGYPMAWTIQTWLAGATASPIAVADSVTFTADLAALIATLRATPTRGRRFTGRGRGGDLRAHDDWVETCLSNSQHLLEVQALRRLWSRLRTTPRRQADRMTHGDLIPGNLLIADSRLIGVLDTGGFAPADPSLDLVSAWHLLDGDAREVLRDELDCDDNEWERGEAWAFQQAIGTAWYYQTTNPAMHEMGMTTLRRLLASRG
jgi:aminoglycoside phosphotransferase (APT) family kinase protein